MSFIRNREQMKQLKDFSGLLNNGRYPTDIDGFGDYGKENVFVFIEVKHDESIMPDGQKYAYEAVSDACEKAGKISVVLIANHLVPIPDDIPVAPLSVIKIRMHRQWFIPRETLTVKETIDKLLKTKTLWEG